MKSIDIQEALPELLFHLTSDLAECLGAAWAVAASSVAGEFLPLAIHGDHPNLERCMACLALDPRPQSLNDSALQPEGFIQDGLGVAKLVFPLRLADNDCVLAFGPRADGLPYTPKDRALVEEFARHLDAVAKNNLLAGRITARMAAIRKTEADLASARQVQNCLFPRYLPRIEGLDYWGECHPAEEVGGDFFDFVGNEHTTLTASIGDVSGKGMPAAIITSGLQATLRARIAGHCARLSRIVHDLNHTVWELSPSGFYATMFCGRFDLSRRELRYVNAGHPAPLLIRAKRERVLRLDATGAPLGVAARARFGQRAVSLEHGDVFLALTDGVSDALERLFPNSYELVLLNIVREHREENSHRIAKRIIELLDAKSPAFDEKDDKTVIVARLEEAAEFTLQKSERLQALMQAA